MGHNQTPMQTKPREQFVQIPKEEHHSATVMNQTGTLNRTDTIKWPTIIICTILVITGQSIVKLLENYYYLHTINKPRATWFQSLLQVIGFPLLRTPLYIHFYPDPRKPNQLPPSSDRTSLRFLTVLYPGIGVGMVFHARLYTKGKLEIPFNVFTLIYTTQLLFTMVLSFIIKKFKFNRWIVISLFFAMAAGALTLSSSFPGEPENDTAKYRTGVLSAIFAALSFSYIITGSQNVFDNVISKRDVATNRKPSFASVFELIFFSSILPTIVFLAGLFITGEHHVFKAELRGFSEGKRAYILTMMGQVGAWQIYWVGLVGLVFAVSSIFSNVISVCTWPIVSLLGVLFFDSGKDDLDYYKGAAIVAALLSVVSYFYRLRIEKRNSYETTS
ncbi:unnamed protein product [Eruca vesicaria subsp. sativa]|uniref:Probable purine permease n=1 Tax=Eruca vesicaria subsp. sativa TaxID=29727 RepID=A0ABC8LHR8_ERUVS|nr:unnamed protein product [Eruca vesicaria subsp. sativa]